MTPDPVRAFATLTLLRGALVSAAIALLAGLLAVLHYVDGLRAIPRALGLEFTALRPLHTVFASAWIFLAGLAVVHHYLERHAGPVTTGDRWRLRLQVALWAIAGAAVLITLPLGILSGREYMGFHPLVSVPILLGWLLFCWNFFRATGSRFWERPVYVTMWGVGCLFFVATFLEQHLWLLPDVFERPVVDLRQQWKACGTLVGSFNLFVYGALLYLGEQLTGDSSYGRSRLAYALLGVGLLNSFTNFAHHTYHVPQDELIKWIGFVVSMSELVLLAKVVWDLASAARERGVFRAAAFFLGAAKWWTAAMLFTSILISIPPLNSLIHGTHVVTAHAMGTEIGIDSMVLFAAVSWLLADRRRRAGLSVAPLHGAWIRRCGWGLNLSAAALVVWLNVSGGITGVTRTLERPLPEWLGVASPLAFLVFGSLMALFLALLLWRWLRLAGASD